MALQELEIAHLAQRYYHQLSGGEKQLVLIARAIAQQAKLLIMDEPTSSLDFGNQIRVLEKIKQLQKQNIALIISTHNPQQAAFLGIILFCLINNLAFNKAIKTFINLRKLGENLPHFVRTFTSTFE